MHKSQNETPAIIFAQTAPRKNGKDQRTNQIQGQIYCFQYISIIGFLINTTSVNPTHTLKQLSPL